MTKSDAVKARAVGGRKRASGKKASKRCWSGYKPAPGKKAYSKGSCKKA